MLGSSLPTYTQTPSLTPRQQLILEIKGYAKRHVENDTPMQTQYIGSLFKENQIGLKEHEISLIYEEEYDRIRKLNQGSKKSQENTNLWQQLVLTPKKLTWGTIGWGTAIILFFLLIFRNVLENWLTKGINTLGNWFYNKLAGSPLLLRTALRRYQKSLVVSYKELKIVYRTNLPLDMGEVYVPLKVAGGSDSEQIDAKQAIAEYPRLMVKGLPGSGKSMLLKHLALTYGEKGRLINLPEKPVPVLVELHELTDSALDLEKLEQHLVQVLDRHNFPKAKRFVSESLKQGKLLLLFDGLDEVNSNVRPQVVQAIKNLLQKDQYRKCPALITCRTAVYNDEFNNLVDQTLEIVEFNDRQIRLFLKSWASQMPPEKSIDQLLKTLRDKPRIMTLARNPLLLTIIAYLYCDTAFVLPDSRSEFYRKSTDVLLELRDEERGIANQYRANEKRRVLQKLALYNQDNAQSQQQDRRSINYETVLAEIQSVLPSLSLNPNQDTKAILQEIVERSGLFIQIDSGDKYQFAHLSIQEFFA